MKISPIATKSLTGAQAPAAGSNAPGGDFAQTLMDVMKEVNASQLHSKQMQTALVTNQPVEIHDVMIAMEQASVAMQLTMQVRNKLLEAYQEVSRTQI